MVVRQSTTPIEFKCDVCGAAAIGVACSATGPISFAYCRLCLEENADVPSAIINCIACCGGIEHVSQYIIDMIEPSCRRAKITRRNFDTSLKKAVAAMLEYDGS